MNLKLLLPFQIFVKKVDVLRIVAETSEGSFGLLPNRLDCATTLVPGILLYETLADGEVFVAIDEGVMIKAGSDVLVSVRQAFGGANLSKLRESIEEEFLTVNEHEKSARSVIDKLEIGFLHRFATLQHE